MKCPPITGPLPISPAFSYISVSQEHSGKSTLACSASQSDSTRCVCIPTPYFLPSFPRSFRSFPVHVGANLGVSIGFVFLLPLYFSSKASVSRTDSSASSVRSAGALRSMLILPTNPFMPALSILSIRYDVASLCMVPYTQACMVPLASMSSTKASYTSFANPGSAYFASSGKVHLFSQSSSSRSISRPLLRYCGACT